MHALTPSERRKVALLAPLYRLTGPVRPLVTTLTDALLGPGSATTHPEAAAIVAGAFRRASRRGIRIAIKSVSLGRPDLTPALGSITAPTLICVGFSDPMWTPAAASAAVARLPSGAFAPLPGAGHVAPLLEAAPALADLIATFWRDPAALADQGADTSPTPHSSTA